MKERRKRLAALFAAFCLVLMLLPVPAVRAEDGNGYTYIAPTLSKSADPYDPEKPEELSADYIIPAAFDKRVGPAVAKAVAEAARRSGVARI